jgi:hypothetical protein
LQSQKNLALKTTAEVAHLVEHDLAKVGVAGSSPVFRSYKADSFCYLLFFKGASLYYNSFTRVVELVDTQDLKSCSQ